MTKIIYTQCGNLGNLKKWRRFWKTSSFEEISVEMNVGPVSSSSVPVTCFSVVPVRPGWEDTWGELARQGGGRPSPDSSQSFVFGGFGRQSPGLLTPWTFCLLHGALEFCFEFVKHWIPWFCLTGRPAAAPFLGTCVLRVCVWVRVLTDAYVWRMGCRFWPMTQGNCSRDKFPWFTCVLGNNVSSLKWSELPDAEQALGRALSIDAEHTNACLFPLFRSVLEPQLCARPGAGRRNNKKIPAPRELRVLWGRQK